MTDTKLKPFDLAAALAGAPVVTRDGRKILQIAHFPHLDKSQEVLVAIEGRKYVQSRNKFGVFSISAEANDDLFMAPVKRTVWVNMYRSDECSGFEPALFLKKDDATRKSYVHGYIGTYPIEIEE